MVIKKIWIVVFLLASFSLTACQEQEEVKTVEWYTEHPTERAERLNICADNPAKYEKDPNCINAKRSELINSTGDVRNKKWSW